MRPTASAAWLKGGVLFFGKIETKDIIRGGISMKNIYSSLLAIGALVVFTSAFAVRPAEAINLQSWDKQINNPSRFMVLNQFIGIGQAVLDNETGHQPLHPPSLSRQAVIVLLPKARPHRSSCLF